jgi:chemotaxis protein CheD
MPAHQSLATLHYYDRQFDAPAVKVLPTEYYVTGSDIVLTTVLGSCVSACVYDTTAGIGGMNHFMLPGKGESDRRDAVVDMRYGAYAMDVLMHALVKAGARRERLVAKVFGGAAVLPGMTQLNIGQRNAQFVLAYLDDQGVPLAAQDLGGSLPRRICHFPGSGRVAVRKLRREEDVHQVRQEEQQLMGLVALLAPRPVHTAL